MVWKSFIPWVCPAGHQREVPGLCAEEASLYHCQYEPTLAPSISFQLWLLLYSIHRSNRFKDATASLALFLDIRWWVGSKLNDISMKWQRRTIKWGLQSRKMKKDLGISKKKGGGGKKCPFPSYDSIRPEMQEKDFPIRHSNQFHYLHSDRKDWGAGSGHSVYRTYCWS